MCGIAGFFRVNNTVRSKEAASILRSMCDKIEHRGPDDHGEWFDNNAGIGLAHRRLSILDLSSAGHQPMFSSSGRYVITFNGEIYNHLDLRKKLPNENWRGHSDTETFLVAIEKWGLDKSLQMAIGMFAFALWDSKEQVLFLARDRIGEKPLYYGWQGNSFIFASELKAIRAFPEFRTDIDKKALYIFLRFGCIPAPFSIFNGIFKLIPGTYIKISQKNRPGEYPKPLQYWSLEEVAQKGLRNPFEGSFDEAVNHLEKLLKQSLEGQMLSDVPIGAFLSGGIDSSTVSALMQSLSSRPIKTFTIGFNEKRYNEAQYASEIARHIGSEHTEFYVSPSDALDVIPKLPKIYDEPFADASQIPTFLLCKLTRKHVTVALSGDAGDELFCGYRRYFSAERLWNKIHFFPLPIRRLFADIMHYLPENTFAPFINSVFPKDSQGIHQPAYDRFMALADVLKSKNLQLFYQKMTSAWKQPELIIRDFQMENPLKEINVPEFRDIKEKLMFWDMLNYLPDDILVKVDRAAMSVNLETRIPFLDHRIIEFSYTLPPVIKSQNGVGKLIIKNLLYKYVPIDLLIERPKMGFSMPIDIWLRRELRDWAENLLLPQNLAKNGFKNISLITRKWQEHLSGKYSWHQDLWHILMFQAWAE